jgi:hypothetical protein
MILDFFENLFCYPPTLDPASVLLKFPNGTKFTVKDSFEGIGFNGGIGSGKTSAAMTIRQSFLQHGYGLLVPCVKADEAASWEKLASKTGRSNDLILFRADGLHCYNPFSQADPWTVVAFLEDLGEMLSKGTDSARFWQAECNKIAHHAAVIARHGRGFIDLGDMAAIVTSYAHDAAQVESKTWQQRSACYHLLVQAEQRSPGHSDVALAREFFLETFPGYDPKTRGNVLAMVGNLLEHFRREPLCSMFGGRSTVTPQDILERQKIVVIDVPVLAGPSSVGTIANGIWLYAFCRALTQRQTSLPAALWIDEAQFLVSPELMRTQTIIRSHGVSTVLLFQNLAVLEERMAKTAVEGLLGTMNTTVFTRQAHAGTRQWAADHIGKVIKTRRTENHSRHHGVNGGSSTSESEERIVDYKFHPHEFANLTDGDEENSYKVESIVLTGAKAFRARWHQKRPGKGGTVKPI